MSYFDVGYDEFKQQRVTDLATATIPGESCTPKDGQALADVSARNDAIGVRAIFRNLEQELVSMISEADFVVGCVAWLTSEPILEALAAIHGAQIVVQKEDFLRPDMGASTAWKRHLRRMYDALEMPVDRSSLPSPVGGMSYCGSPYVDAVRCVGNHNAAKSPAFPRMHHKFVVFCRRGLEPYAVWTGSFNFTKNAGSSLENALVLTDHGIVQAYFREWAQILAISEPLDWRSEWVAPQWRIGS